MGVNRERLKENFIEAARNLHGDRFSYFNVNYQNCKTKVEITCINKSSGKTFKCIYYIFSENGQEALTLENSSLAFMRNKYKSCTEVFDGSTEAFYISSLPEFFTDLKLSQQS